MKLKLAFLFAAFIVCTNLYAQSGFPFAKEVQAFKHQDSLEFPKPNGVLFIGASSIRKWADLEQRFTGVHIIKRGVGGSELWQWAQYYMPYIVFPYHPRKIFLYAGENDMAVGKKTLDQTFEAFTRFYTVMRKELPDVEFYYLAQKASPSRPKFIALGIELNNRVKAYIADKPKNIYVDLATPILNDKMQPDSSLFVKDMLHLNSKGYDKWQAALQDYVK
jgi:lysophospholipase L1-like esterase